MGEVLEQRKTNSDRRLEDLRIALVESERLIEGAACVYVTGSFGRSEASEHSDLDPFIVGKVEGGQKKRSLSRLDEIRLQAALIEHTSQLQFPPFDRDGAFLSHHTIEDLVETLGKPEDDAANTFTARLLLLLESTPLLGDAVYAEVLESVVKAYWRDYDDHKDHFMPMYLANDILRLWRTFCINYEARTQTDPPEKKAKRKLKNYKLKHSRLLTCYSALAQLLVLYQKEGTVTPEAALEMVKLSPTQRLAWIEGEAPKHKNPVTRVIESYERFLSVTAKSEKELVKEFLDSEQAKGYQSDATELGQGVFELLRAIGSTDEHVGRFYQFLVV